MTDEQLFPIIRQKLFTAAIGDILDTMGFLHQFLPPGIKPLRDDMTILGRAMPVLEEDCHGPGDQPFGLMLQALDDLKPNEVYIASGGSPRYAFWGELMSTRAMHLKAAGAIVNGYSRDTPGILRLNFPVFSMGRYAQDQGYRGKVVDYRVDIEVEGVRVSTGDLVFADLDGILVVPQEAEHEAISKALEKASKENLVRAAIEKGMSTVEAFDRFGVM